MRLRPVDVLICFNRSMNRQEKEYMAEVFRKIDLPKAEERLTHALRVNDKSEAVHAVSDIAIAKKAIAQLKGN